jgi:crotonobetainyl-CoA:carnitine CoA-transferase CaiB-like acyl-CoA transferase
VPSHDRGVYPRHREIVSEESTAPLAGVLVADFSRVLAGPLVGMTLGDLGAEVIKVESPGGDDTRSWAPPVDREGGSTYFHCANRNKRSVVLDLKSASDLALARRLCKRADVMIANFRPGTLERFGLDYGDHLSTQPGDRVLRDQRLW